VNSWPARRRFRLPQAPPCPPRELVAADFVYTIKRFCGPALRSEWLYQWENARILVLSEPRRRVLAEKLPFPYDEPVTGLRTLDRHRFEVRLAEPAPRFTQLFASPTLCGAVAREVIERYAAGPQAHPLGTGPFTLAQWRRASRIALVRNPRFREQRFAGAPAEGDAAAQAVAQRLAGTRARRVDRIELDIIEESQPRWLAFLNGEHDVVQVPSDLAALVGGYTADMVALRRAIALAYDSAKEIRLARGGQVRPVGGNRGVRGRAGGRVLHGCAAVAAWR
jgi:ABC-type transport system substrate-binding protein